KSESQTAETSFDKADSKELLIQSPSVRKFLRKMVEDTPPDEEWKNRRSSRDKTAALHTYVEQEL
ncbi:MAG: hypothetical protein LBU27_09540, partial [Candidatus Peribacteria bacterium]|nr:hypothetical protein [Candidatus Peribacteria bacterium]